MGTTMVQMNTRIPADLKEQGDLALAQAGYTPSQAVRALWEFAAEHVHEPKAVRRRLSRKGTKEKTTAIKPDDPFAQWENTARELYKKMGISPESRTSAISYEKLKELAYLERAEKLGL